MKELDAIKSPANWSIVDPNKAGSRRLYGKTSDDDDDRDEEEERNEIAPLHLQFRMSEINTARPRIPSPRTGAIVCVSLAWFLWSTRGPGLNAGKCKNISVDVPPPLGTLQNLSDHGNCTIVHTLTLPVRRRWTCSSERTR